MTTENYRKVKEITGMSTRILSFKYLAPTNTKGSRVKLIDKRFNRFKTIPYDYEFNNAVEVAVNYLLSEGWNVAGINCDDSVIIMGEWDSDKQL